MFDWMLFLLPLDGVALDVAYERRSTRGIVAPTDFQSWLGYRQHRLKGQSWPELGPFYYKKRLFTMQIIRKGLFIKMARLKKKAPARNTAGTSTEFGSKKRCFQKGSDPTFK